MVVVVTSTGPMGYVNIFHLPSHHKGARHRSLYLDVEELTLMQCRATADDPHLKLGPPNNNCEYMSYAAGIKFYCVCATTSMDSYRLILDKVY